MHAGAPPMVDAGPQQALAARARPGAPPRRSYDVHGLGDRFTEEAMGGHSGEDVRDLRRAIALWLRVHPETRLGTRKNFWGKKEYGFGPQGPWACTSCPCVFSSNCRANRERGFSIGGAAGARGVQRGGKPSGGLPW